MSSDFTYKPPAALGYKYRFSIVFKIKYIFLCLLAGVKQNSVMNGVSLFYVEK